MERVQDEDGCEQKSVSFRPKKIRYPFSKVMDTTLHIGNLGRAISILVIYAIRHYKDKRFIKELEQINKDIVKGNITIPNKLLG